MDKDFVFRIGPFESAEGLTYFYYVYPGQEEDFLFVANSDEEGFEKILENYSPDELECEPELAEIGAHYGIPVGELTLRRSYNILLMGLESLEEEHFREVSRGGLIYQFSGTAADFWQAQPWSHAFAKLPLQFVFDGSINLTLYGFVMGEGKQEYGLALYKTREDLKTMIALARGGLLQDASDIDSFGVLFHDEPPYAVHAMQRAHGIDKVPVPVMVQDKKRCFITDLDILALAAALEAVSVMDDGMEFATGRVSVADVSTVCKVTPLSNS